MMSWLRRLFQRKPDMAVQLLYWYRAELDGNAIEFGCQTYWEMETFLKGLEEEGSDVANEGDYL